MSVLVHVEASVKFFWLACKTLIGYSYVPVFCSPLLCYTDISHCASRNWRYLSLFERL